MVDQSQIREKMEVVGSDSVHVGTVDHVDGTRIKLTRKDPAADGKHHYIPIDWVADVGAQIRLRKTADDAKQTWQAAE
ncbi:MAG: DUF2171 domain-containing protein [Gemmatimonadota bacterium]|nr:DUF2171 domain-containing protein [Gemmatimonadota bacterium]